MKVEIKDGDTKGQYCIRSYKTLFDKLKMICIFEDTNISDLLTDILLDYVKNYEVKNENS